MRRDDPLHTALLVLGEVCLVAALHQYDARRTRVKAHDKRLIPAGAQPLCQTGGQGEVGD